MKDATPEKLLTGEWDTDRGGRQPELRRQQRSALLNISAIVDGWQGWVDDFDPKIMPLADHLALGLLGAKFADLGVQMSQLAAEYVVVRASQDHSGPGLGAIE